MYRGIVYGRDLCMAGSPYALLAFKREFGESLPNIARLVQLRYATAEEIDIPSLLGICWAMCKSFDDHNTPGFDQWYADFNFKGGEIPDDIGEAVIALDQIWTAVEQELMVYERPCPDADKQDGAGRAGKHDSTEWVEWKNILSLLRLGFSFDDIKHMPMKDFIGYTDLIAAEYPGGKQQDTVVEADQAAIDRLFF
ncbi:MULTISPECIES: hypothetical protein [unclassified Adlercreutzia]|uniref:hypothetical protein n=1 Tax=unclassified Adlercreutzia TaxID=2636013 RepID=UPI0013EB46E1|nr:MULTISPECIES: hypothetical protein [unclassified Adlercreutzia]